MLYKRLKDGLILEITNVDVVNSLLKAKEIEEYKPEKKAKKKAE